jgi:hypothetical protein
MNLEESAHGDVALLTLFAIRASTTNHRHINQYAIQGQSPTTFEAAVEELRRVIDSRRVSVSGETLGDTLQIAVKDRMDDPARAEFLADSLLRYEQMLTRLGDIPLDNVQVRLRAEDGEMKVPARDFLRWRDVVDMEVSMLTFNAPDSSQRFRTMDVTFGRHTLKDGVVVQVPFD